MVHARHRLCPLATVGCAAVCLTETQLSLVSGSCNGRGGSLRERRLSSPRRPPPLRGRRVDIAPGQSVVKQSDLCAHHINEYQSRSAIVASRCAVARARGVFYGVMVMTVMEMEWAVNP